MPGLWILMPFIIYIWYKFWMKISKNSEEPHYRRPHNLTRVMKACIYKWHFKIRYSYRCIFLSKQASYHSNKYWTLTNVGLLSYYASIVNCQQGVMSCLQSGGESNEVSSNTHYSLEIFDYLFFSLVNLDII